MPPHILYVIVCIPPPTEPNRYRIVESSSCLRVLKGLARFERLVFIGCYLYYIYHTHTCTHTHAHTIWTRCESFRYCIANLHECIKHVPHFATLLHCSAWHWFTRIASTICFGGLENCYCRVPDKRQKKLLVKVNRVQHFQFLCYSKFAMLFHFYLNAQFWALFGDLFIFSQKLTGSFYSKRLFA